MKLFVRDMIIATVLTAYVVLLVVTVHPERGMIEKAHHTYVK